MRSRGIFRLDSKSRTHARVLACVLSLLRLVTLASCYSCVLSCLRLVHSYQARFVTHASCHELEPRATVPRQIRLRRRWRRIANSNKEFRRSEQVHNCLSMEARRQSSAPSVGRIDVCVRSMCDGANAARATETIAQVETMGDRIPK